MTARAFDPRSVDIAAFAKQGSSESGGWPVAALERLCAEVHADARPAATEHIQWRATGETRTRRGGEPQLRMHLECRAGLSLICQRCLQPVAVVVQVQRSFLFAADEAAAAAIDADSDDDVLALCRTLDLIDLIEDELLLALPLVPRHEVCPQPLAVRDDDALFEERPNPFAVLSAMKPKVPLN